ncbi:MAG: hypothetical protein KDA62_04490 [Planctomycetales bacterium]|nr:hypothetical protein [Planctomycetales bacterium]
MQHHDTKVNFFRRPDKYRTIAIRGSVEFTYSTRAALEVLNETSHWPTIENELKIIVEVPTGHDSLRERLGVYGVGHHTWERSHKAYATAIAGEGYRRLLAKSGIANRDQYLEDHATAIVNVSRDIRARSEDLITELVRVETLNGLREEASCRRSRLARFIRFCLTPQQSAESHGISIRGSKRFVDLTKAAIEKLATTSRFSDICASLDTIQQGLSNCAVEQNGRRVARIESDASWLSDPNYYAGIIAHEACHHMLGRPTPGSDMYSQALEMEQHCLDYESAVFEELGSPRHADYLKLMRHYPAYIGAPSGPHTSWYYALLVLLASLFVAGILCLGWW